MLQVSLIKCSIQVLIMDKDAWARAEHFSQDEPLLGIRSPFEGTTKNHLLPIKEAPRQLINLPIQEELPSHARCFTTSFLMMRETLYSGTLINF